MNEWEDAGKEDVCFVLCIRFSHASRREPLLVQWVSYLTLDHWPPLHGCPELDTYYPFSKQEVNE